MGLSFKNNHFGLKTFFSQALRKFSIRRMTMFDIFKRRAQHSSLRQLKKLGPYDTPIKKYIHETARKSPF